MTKEEYHQLLKDGRWQRKRLEIMQRDGFRCTKCGTTNDLNVHHLRYITGRKPWEYYDADLITLCGNCHKKEHEDIDCESQEGFSSTAYQYFTKEELHRMHKYLREHAGKIKLGSIGFSLANLKPQTT